MFANNNLYFVGNLVTEIYFFSRSYHLSVSGRKECFPCQLALFPSFEYYSFCSAHNYMRSISCFTFKFLIFRSQMFFQICFKTKQ